jgi:hypothetical protein
MIILLYLIKNNKLKTQLNSARFNLFNLLAIIRVFFTRRGNWARLWHWSHWNMHTFTFRPQK